MNPESTRPEGEGFSALSRPERLEVLDELLDQLVRLKASGTLDSLIETAELASAARNALTDSAIERIAELAESLAGLVARRDVVDLLQALAGAAAEASEKARVSPPGTGLLAVLGALRDPDIRRMLGFLAFFAQGFNRRIHTPGHGPPL